MASQPLPLGIVVALVAGKIFISVLTSTSAGTGAGASTGAGATSGGGGSGGGAARDTTVIASVTCNATAVGDAQRDV